MLEVQIENIIPVTEARDRFNQIVDAVEGTEELYVLTKNGKPAAIVVGVHHLEKLTGESHEAVFGKDEPAPAATIANENPMPEPVTPDVMPAAPIAAAAPLPQEAQPTAQPEAINYDSQPMASIAPAPTADVMASTPIPMDSPLIDPVSADGSQAIAPDAVTPTQAGPSSDPFALPTEPLDLPSDNQAGGGAVPAAAPVDDTQTAQTPAPQA